MSGVRGLSLERRRERCRAGPPSHDAPAGLLALAGALAVVAWPAQAQHVSYWAGQGGGFFLEGGSGGGDPDSHSLGAFALSLFGDRVRVRYLRGSLERDEGYQKAFGDNDVDYRALDAVLTARTTGLPLDVALGLARYEEGFVRANGVRYFDRRWGPHLSILREIPLWRFLSAWGECDLHDLPYRPQQVVVFLDVGLGVHM